MTQVLIRAELPVAGLRVGHPPTVVEETDFIKTLAADGKITILERYDDEVAPDPVEPETEPDGEYDATHGEAAEDL